MSTSHLIERNSSPAKRPPSSPPITTACLAALAWFSIGTPCLYVQHFRRQRPHRRHLRIQSRPQSFAAAGGRNRGTRDEGGVRFLQRVHDRYSDIRCRGARACLARTPGRRTSGIRILSAPSQVGLTPCADGFLYTKAASSGTACRFPTKSPAYSEIKTNSLARGMRWVLAASFRSVAIWALFPDKVAEDDCSTPRAGAFATALVTFFLAEIGDKTQIATMGLHADLLVSRGDRRNPAAMKSSYPRWTAPLASYGYCWCFRYHLFWVPISAPSRSARYWLRRHPIERPVFLENRWRTSI